MFFSGIQISIYITHMLFFPAPPNLKVNLHVITKVNDLKFIDITSVLKSYIIIYVFTECPTLINYEYYFIFEFRKMPLKKKKFSA